MNDETGTSAGGGVCSWFLVLGSLILGVGSWGAGRTNAAGGEAFEAERDALGRAGRAEGGCRSQCGGSRAGSAEGEAHSGSLISGGRSPRSRLAGSNPQDFQKLCWFTCDELLLRRTPKPDSMDSYRAMASANSVAASSSILRFMSDRAGRAGRKHRQ